MRFLKSYQNDTHVAIGPWIKLAMRPMGTQCIAYGKESLHRPCTMIIKRDFSLFPDSTIIFRKYILIIFTFFYIKNVLKNNYININNN